MGSVMHEAVTAFSCISRLAELAAGCVDIRAEPAPHGRGHAALFQRLLEPADGLRPRGRQRTFRYLVERNEVDVRRSAFQQLRQLVGLPRAVGLVAAPSCTRRKCAARWCRNSTGTRVIRRSTGYASFTGMMDERVSSSGACSDTDSVICSFSRANIFYSISNSAG